jgi:hypothetical protein
MQVFVNMGGSSAPSSFVRSIASQLAWSTSYQNVSEVAPERCWCLREELELKDCNLTLAAVKRFP